MAGCCWPTCPAALAAVPPALVAAAFVLHPVLTVASAVALLLIVAPTVALVELSAQPSAVPHPLPSVVVAALGL